jgi:CHAT domain-containing protein/Flp pilus assembly protein TadD
LSLPEFLFKRFLSLNNLAWLYDSQGRYEEAEPLILRVLDIWESELGANHPNTALSLNNLAGLYLDQGRYEEAEPLMLRALDIWESELGANHPNTALSLNNLALLYQSQGRYEEAEPLMLRALDIWESELGANHPNTATTLNNLALLYESQGRYEEAEPLILRALEIHEGELGANHPDTAQSLNNLAELYRVQGRYEEAEPLMLRALDIWESELGANHPNTATTLNNLALLYESQGRYEEAEPLYRRALDIRESELGANHPNTALSLNNLAELYRVQGRYEEAEPLILRALEIHEGELGANHPDTALSLNNLAELYESQGRYEDAEPLLRRALDIWKSELGTNHPKTATSLSNLAGLYQSQGRYEDAEPLYRRALDIKESELGANHPDTATSLNNLAELYRVQGRYEEAEPLILRALDIWESELGANHPNTATSLNNLAVLSWNQGRYEEALAYLKQGITTEESVLQRNLVGGSDANKRDYLATMAETLDASITLSLRDLPDNSQATQLALSTIIQRKGRILDLFTNLRSQFNDDPETLDLFNELKTVTSQLTALTYNPPPTLSPETLRTQRQNLETRFQELEDTLSRRSRDFANLTASPSVSDLQAALPTNTALVEFIRYQTAGQQHYAAYILHPDGRINGIDLGSAEKIDQTAEHFSAALNDPNTPKGQVKTTGNDLEQLIIAPIRQHLGDTTTLFLSPDGALNQIPFEALVDESGNYLVEHYQFRYLTSGRDLMRLTHEGSPINSAALVGDPTYGVAGTQIAQADTRSIDFENRIFPRLPGTQQEVEQIAALLPNASLYTESNATELAIKTAVAQPDPIGILHIATHGFFEPASETENPLLSSGLILAGAAAGGQSGTDQDGILSALEVTGLELSNTQLVVLSACQTGLGEASTGEGLYGLRRALVLAGARSQVISLWKVDDTATQKLMVDYYNRLIAGTPRDEALRATQRAFIADPEYSHPYYWAAFIASGDWRSL